MGHFIRNQSIAVIWDARSCRALRLEAKGSTCTVAACWHGETGKDGSSVAELIPMAFKALNGDDSIYTAVAGEGGWGMNDITLPAALKGDDLKNALSFELSKQTPLPADRIKWGYRTLENSKDAAERRLRIFFIRNDTWDSWIKAMNGLHHVDAMLPAPVILDPLLAGKVFSAPADGGNAVWSYIPEIQGRSPRLETPETPPALDSIFDSTIFQAGALAGYEPDEQLAFAPAVLLGMYALSPAITADAGTVPPLPERFHARRHLAAKLTAALLALYLLGLIVFFLAGAMQKKAAEIRVVDQELAKVNKELKTLYNLMDPKANERITLLRQELLENAPKGPSFPAALLEITRLVGKDAWISNSLEWKEGGISFQIQTPVKDVNLAQRLEFSEILGDVSEKLSTFNQTSNSYTQRFELTVREDSPEELQMNRIRREKEEERQRQLREQEAQESEEAPEEAKGWDD